MYRFLLTRRWLGLLALVVALAVACVLLGSWQWSRREQRLERNAQVVDNYDREPAPLESVLDDGSLPVDRTWSPVRMRGEYVQDATILVRNRPLDGRPGYQVLVPLVTDGGRALLVDRGWVSTGSTGQDPDVVPAPPPGQVEVVARLRPSEPSTDRDAPPGHTLSINPDALAVAMGEASAGEVDPGAVVSGAYGLLASESPAPESPLEAAPRPALDEGPHLSYAMQWVVFALMALVGFVVLARRTAEWDVQEPGPTKRPTRPPKARRGPRRPTAEDEEDAIVDAAERAARTRQPTRPPA